MGLLVSGANYWSSNGSKIIHLLFVAFNILILLDIMNIATPRCRYRMNLNFLAFSI